MTERYRWVPRRIQRSSRPHPNLKLEIEKVQRRERKIDARLTGKRRVSFRVSNMVSEPLSVSLRIACMLDGTIYGTGFRVHQLVPKSFWNPRDPGWRTLVIVRPVPVLTSALKSWVDRVIVPILVSAYLQEVRP
jgi:hypothetical protein